MRDSKLFKSILLWLVDEDAEFGLSAGEALPGGYLTPDEAVQGLCKVFADNFLPLDVTQSENVAKALLSKTLHPDKKQRKNFNEADVYDRFKILLSNYGVLLNDGSKQFDRLEWAIVFLNRLITPGASLPVVANSGSAEQIGFAVAEITGALGRVEGIPSQQAEPLKSLVGKALELAALPKQQGTWVARMADEMKGQGKDQLLPLPEKASVKAPPLWKDRKEWWAAEQTAGRIPTDEKLNVPNFFRRAYDAFYDSESNSIPRHAIRHDKKGYLRLAKWLELNGQPDGFVFATKSDEIETTLGKIAAGQDPVPLDFSTRSRLAAAASRRGQRLIN